MDTLDSVRIHFSEDNLVFLNCLLGFIMFGVALNLKIEDFKRVFANPKSAIIGLSSQFILLPLATFLLALILRPTPSVALGMIMVAACPGGNVSNFLTSVARGNTALAVSMTAIGTVLAIVMTPFNFQLYGSLYGPTRSILREVSVNPIDMFKTVFILLGIPLTLGILFAQKWPFLTGKIKQPLRNISLLIFVGFIIMAFAANFDIFVKYILLVFFIVLIQNGTALLLGYFYALKFRLSQTDCRALSIETGIHNSGLGLVLIFNFFNVDKLGGMAMVTAWWGVWHIISGLSLALFWSKKPLRP
jgi:bile acid:Na+ symporter, BASS family